MPRHHPYGAEHKRTRARLIRQLPRACPICGRLMRTPADAELHHTSAEAKALGRTGSQLICRQCNRSIGGPSRPRRVKHPESTRKCSHLAVLICAEPPPGRCECDEPATCQGVHAHQCKSCGGWQSGRV